LEWLQRQKTDVRRYNLAHEPMAFVANEEVKRVLEETSGDGLPVILLDGRVVRRGSYPSRDELASWIHTSDAKDELCVAQSAATEGADRSTGSGIDLDEHRPTTEMTNVRGGCGNGAGADCCDNSANPLVTLDASKENNG
jgi:hypothetical protein